MTKYNPMIDMYGGWLRFQWAKVSPLIKVYPHICARQHLMVERGLLAAANINYQEQGSAWNRALVQSVAKILHDPARGIGNAPLFKFAGLSDVQYGMAARAFDSAIKQDFSFEMRFTPEYLAMQSQALDGKLRVSKEGLIHAFFL